MPNWLTAHDELPNLLAGAHHRKVSPIGAPALVRMIGIWRDRDTGDWLQHIDKAIMRLCKKHGGLDCLLSENIVEEDAAVLFSGRCGIDQAPEDDKDAHPYRAVKLRFKWRALPVRIHLEAHSEYLSLLITIDFSQEQDANKGNDRHEEAFKRICTVEDEALLIESARTLYEKVWEQFDREALAIEDTGPIGTRFADLRWIVLGTPSPKAKPRGEFQMPFCGPSEYAQDNRPYRVGECQVEKLEQLWPLLTLGEPMKVELTASELLADDPDGYWRGDRGARAMYASAVGDLAQTSRPGPQSLHYLLYSDHVNRWQLGRLIYRLNRAGINRLAAVMHYERLQLVSRQLEIVEEKLRIAERDRQGDDGTEHLLAETSDIQQRLADIATDISLDDGLSHRVERSRYYVKQMERVARSLRIGRIAGYQPYHEFVEQRLGAAFAFIDRLGDRYDRALAAQERLYRRLRLLESVSATKRIEHIQEYADLALVAALIPYYVGYIVATAADGVLQKHFVWYLALLWGLSYAACWRVRKARNAATGAAGLSAGKDGFDAYNIIAASAGLVISAVVILLDSLWKPRALARAPELVFDLRFLDQFPLGVQWLFTAVAALIVFAGFWILLRRRKPEAPPPPDPT